MCFFCFFLQRWKSCLLAHISQSSLEERMLKKTMCPLLKRANYKERLNIVIAFTVTSSSKTWKSVDIKIFQNECEYSILNLETKAKFLLTLMNLEFH